MTDIQFADIWDVEPRESPGKDWRAVDVLSEYSWEQPNDQGGYTEVQEIRVLEQNDSTGEYRVNVIKTVEKYE